MENKYQLDHTLVPEIFKLIRSHENEAAKAHLEQHPEEIHLKGWMSNTPLHEACNHGNLEMVQCLVEQAAEVNAERTGVYATPLCWADTAEIAQYLLEHGATMNDRELYYATRRDKVEVVAILLKWGARIHPFDPQYLQCQSVEAIKAYLERAVNIHGSDSNGSNLLHKMAWQDDPEVFDFVLEQGVEWRRDDSSRTPYILAQQGQRARMVAHLEAKYQDLLALKIKPISLEEAWEDIIYLQKQPEKRGRYIALTRDGGLLAYQLEEQQLQLQLAVEIELPIIRNFTFDAAGHLILPTGDSKLLKIDPDSFRLLEAIKLDKEDRFDQITYLPGKQLYLASSSDWSIIVLDADFQYLSKAAAEDGTFRPIVHESEALFAFESYDQSTYYNLYRLGEDNQVVFLHCFFEDWNSVSKSFAFSGDRLLVAYPKKIESYTYQDGELQLVGTCSIEAYSSAHDHCSLAVLSEELFVLGKGKRLLTFQLSDQIELLEERSLDLIEEIRQLHYDAEAGVLLVVSGDGVRVLEM